MTKIEIKKELYKQKPTAEYNYERNAYKNYSCQIVINGIEEVIEFEIPLSECDFGEVVPAQLLIRWLK